ncbi:hypothetical protein JTE90_011326 [Oedothorax gibbosus]|uniref:Major facilitator superfamily (MFS) profile domain-containing protein n=1 Tax=Oedothorax gibbosus TaxID=931172 RepID=A0AAV6VLX7_9ARAC|nr:hypothetical protein JTE90_011326 [Oedothorax gibbosus]
MSSDKNLEVDSDSMQNVELHRAESMVTPMEDLENQKALKDLQTQNKKYGFSVSATEILNFVKDMKIELVMFLYMFSSVVRMVSTTTMILDKACLSNLNFTAEVCANLSHHPVEKTASEKLANNVSVGHGLILMLPACFISAFIGSWSDKYGRKVPLIIALVGVILDDLGATLCATFMKSRAEFIFIPAVFCGLSGGMISVMTVLYSYASDITTFGQRTIKYAVLEMSFGISMPLGQLVGGWLYAYAGYTPVFLVAVGGHLFALFFVLFVLRETKGLDNTDPWSVKFKNLFSFTPVIDSIKATMKSRPNKGREQILLLIVAMSITVLSYASAGSVSFLYAHHQYDWNNTQYSTVSAIFSIMGIVVMMVVVPVFKWLRLGDALLGVVGNASILAKYVTMGFAIKPGLYYLAHLLGLLGGVGTLAGRSRISKVTSKDDLGKVFAFLSSTESLFPIVATAVVSQIFNATLDFYPGLIFFLIAALLVVPVLIYFWLGQLPVVDYEEMHKNPPGNIKEETNPTVLEKQEKF